MILTNASFVLNCIFFIKEKRFEIVEEAQAEYLHLYNEMKSVSGEDIVESTGDDRLLFVHDSNELAVQQNLPDGLQPFVVWLFLDQDDEFKEVMSLHVNHRVCIHDEIANYMDKDSGLKTSELLRKKAVGVDNINAGYFQASVMIFAPYTIPKEEQDSLDYKSVSEFNIHRARPKR